MCVYIYIYMYTHYAHLISYSVRAAEEICASDFAMDTTHWTWHMIYTRSPSQDFRLFGPRPWNILATTYEKRFLSNPDPGENLVSGNLVMETGCMT